MTLNAAGKAHGLFDGFDANPVFHFANQEHVTAAPRGARVLATRIDMPYCVLDHGDGWLSVQFHPEATERCIALAWKDDPLEPTTNYVALPDAPRLVVNFVLGSGGARSWARRRSSGGRPG